VQFISD